MNSRTMNNINMICLKLYLKKATYGEDELENLIEHNEDVRDDWRLTVSAISLNREVFTSLWIAIADRILYVY